MSVPLPAIGQMRPDAGMPGREPIDEASNRKMNVVNLSAVEPLFHRHCADRRFARLLKKLSLSR